MLFCTKTNKDVLICSKDYEGLLQTVLLSFKFLKCSDFKLSLTKHSHAYTLVMVYTRHLPVEVAIFKISTTSALVVGLEFMMRQIPRKF